MANIDFTDVTDALSRLQLNYTYLAKQWYDIFLNPNPMNVTLSFYDENGQEFEFTIPNRAKDRQFILTGEGSPIGSTDAEVGSLYQDTESGEVYVKYDNGNNSWTCIITKNHLDSVIRQIQGSPEGSEVAPLGTLCVDTMNGYMYMKRTSTGKTGWERIDSYATSKITEVFTFRAPTSSILLNGTCINKNILSIYEDGIKINPDLYDMPYGDNKTIILRKPINIPGEGETVEVQVEYFTDVHVAESAAEQRLVDYVKDARFYSEGTSNEYTLNYVGTVEEASDLPEDTSGLNIGDYFYCVLEECRYIWSGTEFTTEHSAKYYMLHAQEAYENTEYKYENAVNEIKAVGEAEQAKLYAISDDVNNTAVEMHEYIDENAAQFTAGVNKVYNYAQEVSRNRAAVANMTENVKQMEQSTHNYADYVETTVNDLALKSELYGNDYDLNEMHSKYSLEDGGVAGVLDAKIDNVQSSLSNDLNLVNDNINTRIDNVNSSLNTLISDEASERQLNYRELKGTIEFNETTFKNWTTSHSDLGDFSNDAGYFKRDNAPFDLNGIYKYSQDFNTGKEGDVASTSLVLTVNKDCSYYAVDLGDYMSKNTQSDTNFTFTIKYDKSIDLSLPDKMKNNEYTKNYNNVVSVIRCYIKNDTKYLPNITWDFECIDWLGAPPELEAGKSYVVEFISYDMMTSWQAHILGICQPSIEIDTFSVSFTVNSNLLASDDSAAGFPTSEVRMVAVIDGRDFILDDTYEFDNSTGTITVPLEIERRYIGKEITNFYMKSINTEAFKRYCPVSPLHITLAQNESYSADLEDTFRDTSSANNYLMKITSEYIEKYMRGNLTLDEYKLYKEQRDLTYTEVSELPSEGGSGLYVVTSEPQYFYTWYEDMRRWIATDRAVPTSPIIKTLDISGKFTFNWGDISPSDAILATYNYDPDDGSVENGATFTFDVDSGVLVDPLISKSESNRVGHIKIRYDALGSTESGVTNITSNLVVYNRDANSDILIDEIPYYAWVGTVEVEGVEETVTVYTTVNNPTISASLYNGEGEPTGNVIEDRTVVQGSERCLTTEDELDVKTGGTVYLSVETLSENW